ncbi:hypothetical protein ACFPYM_06250, partial [Methylobacterium hispanicum]
AAQTRRVSKADPGSAAPQSGKSEAPRRFLDEVLRDGSVRLAFPKASSEVEPLVAEHNPVFQAARSDLFAIARRAEVVGLPAEYLVALREVALEIRGTAPEGRRMVPDDPFGFSEKAWARNLARFGGEAGFARYGTIVEDGRFVPSIPYREAFRVARTDPAIAGAIAAAVTIDNAIDFQARTGRLPEAGESLLAHFLGVDATVKLVKAAAAGSRLPAFKLVPDAFKANPAFFARGLVPFTAEEILNVAESVIESGMDAARKELRRFEADARDTMDSHVPLPRFG